MDQFDLFDLFALTPPFKDFIPPPPVVYVITGTGALGRAVTGTGQLGRSLTGDGELGRTLTGVGDLGRTVTNTTAKLGRTVG